MKRKSGKEQWHVPREELFVQHAAQLTAQHPAAMGVAMGVTMGVTMGVARVAHTVGGVRARRSCAGPSPSPSRTHTPAQPTAARVQQARHNVASAWQSSFVVDSFRLPRPARHSARGRCAGVQHVWCPDARAWVSGSRAVCGGSILWRLVSTHDP